MNYQKLYWFNKERGKWQTDYSSKEKNPINFSIVDGEKIVLYEAPKSLGADMHAIFEKFFSTIFSKEINIANMSLISPDENSKMKEDYLFGQFEIIDPSEVHH